MVFKGKPFKGAGVHGLGVELKVVSPQVFRMVHCCIRVLDECDDIIPVIGEKTDADASGNYHFMVIQVKGLRNGADYALRHPGRILDIGDVVQKDCEFVSAKARHRGVQIPYVVPADDIAPAYANQKPFRNPLQKLVAYTVAKGVIDILEPVQIQEKDCRNPFCPDCMVKRMSQMLLEEEAIPQAGQAVKIGEIVYLRLSLLTCVYVFHDPGLPERLAVVIVVNFSFGVHNPFFSVGKEYPIVDVIRLPAQERFIY